MLVGQASRETPQHYSRERRSVHARTVRSARGSSRPVNRRDFLGTGAGALAVAGALVVGTGQGKGQEAAALAASKNHASAALPKRTLGRTGVEVTMLNLGTWRSVGLDRILRFAWANGIRYVDTAKSYGSEPAIGRWLTGDARDSARSSSWSPRIRHRHHASLSPISTNGWRR